MNIDDVSKFLGRSVEDKEFDTYLAAHGVSDRPVFKGTPVENIILPERGLVLKFDTRGGYQRRYGPLPDEGGMIFSSLQIFGAHNDSGLEQYEGALPYTLTFRSTFDSAVEIFGEPTVNHKSGPNHVYVWYGFEGHTYAICFLPHNEGISFLAKSRAANKPPIQMD